MRLRKQKAHPILTLDGQKTRKRLRLASEYNRTGQKQKKLPCKALREDA
jgi:hypothetical protein